MANNFAAIAFSEEVKAMQERLGSRTSYARLEKQVFQEGLTENEINFISSRDSFYMASNGKSGFPYIQHRGGPIGFIKVLDSKRLGFVDFKGNKQYISIGNIASDNKVALILVDYPAKARLKIYATADVIELKDNPGLFSLLNLENYKSHPERMLVLSIEAYDWNCPQHIVQRYTIPEIEEAFARQAKYIKALETEIAELKSKF